MVQGPRLFHLMALLSFRVSDSSSTGSHIPEDLRIHPRTPCIQTATKGENIEVSVGDQGPGLVSCLRLASEVPVFHWLDLRHVAPPNGKGGWERQSCQCPAEKGKQKLMET